MDKKPYDDKGQFVQRACQRQNCGGGILQHEGEGIWRCDGLAAPEHDNQPLDACDFEHVDGEPYQSN